MAALVQFETIQKGLVRATFNRPERRNALSIALIDELCNGLRAHEADGESRVVLLQGAGSVFCAGLDLAEASNPELVEESTRHVAMVLHAIKSSPLIIIAVVRGGAYAGGAGIVAACDISIGADDCKIGFPEARRGLLPALIFQVVKNRLREGDLRELFLAGNAIDARRAKEIGLLQRIVPESQLHDEALAIANDLLEGGPQTIIATKQLINASYGYPTNLDHITHAIEEHMKARRSPEATEGLAAFLEKRKPTWLQ